MKNIFSADDGQDTPAFNTRALRAQIKLDEVDLWMFYNEDSII